MTDNPNLAGAYALSSREETKRLYAAWAQSYDSSFSDAQGYLLPRHVVQAFVDAGGRGPVLDVGAGTGLVGQGLAAAGIGPLDAVDLSPEMLDVARSKGIYRNLIAADVTQPLAGGPYEGIVSAGTFTLGHVGPEGIAPLITLAETGCQFVIAVNAKHFGLGGFDAFFAKIGTDITCFQTEDMRIYSNKADLSHRYDMTRLVQFRKA